MKTLQELLSEERRQSAGLCERVGVLEQQLKEAQAQCAAEEIDTLKSALNNSLAELHALKAKLAAYEAQCAALKNAILDIFELASRQKGFRDVATDEGAIDTAMAAVRVIRRVCDERKEQIDTLRKALMDIASVHPAASHLRLEDVPNYAAQALEEPK